jgi:hypothetical protein
LTKVVEKTSNERTETALLTSKIVHGKVSRVQYVDREEVDSNTISTVDHIWNPSRTAILTTLHVKCVVFRRQARYEGRKETSVCVLMATEPEIRQVTGLAQ